MPDTTLPSMRTSKAPLGTSNVTRLHVDMIKSTAANAPLTIEPHDCIDVLYALVSGEYSAPKKSADIIQFTTKNQRLTA